MGLKRRDFVIITVLVVLNLAIRTIWIHHFHPSQQSDFLYYDLHAVEVAKGQGYKELGHYTDYFPMGYIFFLGLIYHLCGIHPQIGMLANALLSTGIVVMLYLFTVRLAKSRTAASLAAFGYTLLPDQLSWNSTLGTEELFTFLLMTSMVTYLWLHKSSVWWMVLPGCAMGIACVVRPILLLFPIFLWLYRTFIERTSFKVAILSMVVFSGAMFLAISPATIRNWEAKHEFVLVSTNGGVNLWQGSHTNNSFYWPSDVAKNPLLKAGYDEQERDKMGKQAFIEYTLRHPKRVAQDGLDKLYNLYKNDPGAFEWYGWGTVKTGKAETLSTFAYLLAMGVSLYGLLHSLLRGKYGFAFLYIVYNTAVFLFFPAWDRFRYPMMPFWFFYFGVAARELFMVQRVSSEASSSSEASIEASSGATVKVVPPDDVLDPSLAVVSQKRGVVSQLNAVVKMKVFQRLR